MTHDDKVLDPYDDDDTWEELKLSPGGFRRRAHIERSRDDEADE